MIKALFACIRDIIGSLLLSAGWRMMTKSGKMLFVAEVARVMDK
jgi:hypothetical protein